jgi:hypothetical protein
MLAPPQINTSSSSLQISNAFSGEPTVTEPSNFKSGSNEMTMFVLPGNGIQTKDDGMTQGQLFESFQIGREVPDQCIIFPDDIVFGNRNNNGYFHGYTDMAPLISGCGS